nr:cellulose biosynthesis protein BcsN [Rhizobium sp. Q54]
MLHICMGLVVSSAATGCNSTGTVTRPVAPSLVSDEQALALPPPGGPAIVGVVERPRRNGVEQTISLATTARVPGQNYLKIEFFGPAVSRGQSAPFRTVHERAILREAAQAIPGVRLARRSTFLQNSYGPFAYAAGHSRLGDTCIYAWQQIRAGTASEGIGRNFGMIQVRWRLCDSHAGEQQLLSAVYNYTITGTFEGKAWNPFGEPGRADSRIGETGHPIYPMAGAPAGSLSIGYAGGVELTPTASVMHRSAPVAVQRPLAKAEAKVREPGPRVPLPGNVTTRAGAENSASAPEQPTAQAPGVRVPSPRSISAPRP